MTPQVTHPRKNVISSVPTATADDDKAIPTLLVMRKRLGYGRSSSSVVRGNAAKYGRYTYRYYVATYESWNVSGKCTGRQAGAGCDFARNIVFFRLSRGNATNGKKKKT